MQQVEVGHAPDVFECLRCHNSVPSANARMHDIHCRPVPAAAIVACRSCTFQNPANALQCQVCEANLEDPDESGWACLLCTYGNSEEVERCEMCETPRSGVVAPEPAPVQAPPRVEHRGVPEGPTGWQCPRCTGLNDQERTHCQMCALPRRGRPGPSRVRPPTMQQPSAGEGLLETFAGAFLGGAIGASMASVSRASDRASDRTSWSDLIAGVGAGAVAGATLAHTAGRLTRGMEESPDVMVLVRNAMDGGELPDSILDQINETEMRPAQREVIANLPTHTASSSSDVENCVICMENYRADDRIKRLPCLHAFHEDCVDPWLRRSGTCPVCKHAL